MNEPISPPFPETLSVEADAGELRAVWDLLDPMEPEPLPAAETEAAWAATAERLALTHGVEESGPSLSVHDGGASARDGTSAGSGLWGGLLQAAAVAALLVGGTWGWYQVPVVHSVEAGQLASVALPDGSEVTLNAGSTLWHRRAFRVFPGMTSDAREVRLQGEAFFEVNPDGRPFRVEAAGARVTVLGTRFNVRARAEGDSEVRVSVEEGRVRVAAARAAEGDGLELGAGESGWLAGVAAEPRRDRVQAERIGAWRSGGLVAVDEALTGILDELTLRYDVPVDLAPGTDGSARLNVYYRELGTLETVLSDLATQQGLSYRRTSDGWEVF